MLEMLTSDPWWYALCAGAWLAVVGLALPWYVRRRSCRRAVIMAAGGYTLLTENEHAAAGCADLLAAQDRRALDRRSVYCLGPRGNRHACSHGYSEPHARQIAQVVR